MYPDADVPVVQLSLDRGRPDRWHYEAGKRLAALRDEGVLIIGSGDIVHNLRAVNFRTGEVPDWAPRFNETAKALIAAGDHDPLIDWRSLGPDAEAVDQQRRALPAPALRAGRAGPGEAVSFFTDEVFAAISMTSVRVG
jgi:4,5-DOPA dioxygenase extradiol